MPTTTEAQARAALAYVSVQNLVMLVGGNPLPMAVLGGLLVKPGGTLILIHTEKTADVATSIEVSFGTTPGFTIEKRMTHWSNRDTIDRDIAAALDKKPGDIGINFTGGTKAMSVHGNRAIEKMGHARQCRTVTSYLDARTLSVEIDGFDFDAGKAVRIRSSPIPVGSVPFGLKKMLGLHHWKLEPNRLTKYATFCPRTASALALLCQRNQESTWRSWVKSLTGPNAVGLPQGAGPQAVAQVLFEENKLTYASSLDDVAACLGFSIPDTKEWMETKWLETAAMNAFLDLSAKFGLNDICSAVELLHVTHEGLKFELDAAAVRGYQLFAVSCIVGEDFKNIKAHLFEVYLRARQIGGDEARVALLSTLADPDRFRKILVSELDAGSNLKVFGRDDLGDLKTAFDDWISKCI